MPVVAGPLVYYFVSYEVSRKSSVSFFLSDFANPCFLDFKIIKFAFFIGISFLFQKF